MAGELIMPDDNLKILLSELTNLRLVCSKCFVTSEIPLDKYLATDSDLDPDFRFCPNCKQGFTHREAFTQSPVNDLMKAIQLLYSIDDKVTVEFLVESNI